MLPIQPQAEVRSDAAPIEIEAALIARVEERVGQIIMTAIREESFSGPMPHPEHLERYDKIVPGSAKLILDEFRENGGHQRLVETRGLDAAISRDRRSQWMAFLLVVAGFGLILYLALNSHDVVASVVASTLLGAVITGFLTKRTAQKGKDTSTSSEDED